MALTPFRWVAAALAGMLIIVAMAMTMPERRVPTDDQLARGRLAEEAASASGRAQAFALQFRVARISDSLRAAMPRSAERGIRVMHAGNVPPAVRAAIDEAVRRAQGEIGTPAAGVDVVTVVDTMPVHGYRITTEGIYPFFMLPETPAQRCVAVLPIGRRWDPSRVRELSGDAVAQRILGPCAFHAAFGAPGRDVHRWLRARGSMLAFGGSWVRPPERMQPPWSVTRSWLNPALESFSFTGIRCTLGEVGACEQAVLMSSIPATPYRPLRTVAVGNAVLPNISVVPTWWRAGTDFGYRESGILAGMVRSLGREKFRAFWTSGDPVALAFEKASGQPLGAWVSFWASEQVEPLQGGPTIPPVVLLETILLVSLSLAVVVLIGRRRQFA